MSSNTNFPATVLVVDDQEVSKLVMCKTLEQAGFHVLSANSGAEALILYRDAQPSVDLLVTDYKMPGMTGVELARECSSMDGELAVLYVSGSIPGDDLRSALVSARQRFLPKPFRQSDFLRSAKEALAMGPGAAGARENQNSSGLRLCTER
ncbi:MAG: response regulator [Acidobacteriota bacterium]